MNQILLELFCMKKTDKCIDAPLPSFCQNNTDIPSYHCLANGCKYVDFTTCENTLCYVGNCSDVEYGISFGGEMVQKSDCENLLKEKWKSISVRKIDEAYDEYLNMKKASESSTN